VRGLGRPVRHHAGRGNDEERVHARVGLLGVAHQRQRLQRLTQAHVVGEDTAQPVAPQEAQPVEPGALVGPQLRGQGDRQLRTGQPSSGQQAGDLLLPGLRLALDHSQRGQLLPQPRLEPADPERTAGSVLQCPGFLDKRAQRLQLGFLQREVCPVRQQKMRLATGESGEHLGERDLASLDGDVDTEIEPVHLARYIAGRHADPQGVAHLPVSSGLPGHLHGDPRRISQQGQHLGGEPQRVQSPQPPGRC
jgi:hypothetical protein